MISLVTADDHLKRATEYLVIEARRGYAEEFPGGKFEGTQLSMAIACRGSASAMTLSGPRFPTGTAEMAEMLVP